MPAAVSAATLDATPQVRHADDLQRGRAVRPVPRTAGYMDGRIQALLSEAAADGRLRHHGDVPRPPPRRRRATSTPGWRSRSSRSPSCPGPPVVVFQDLDDPPVAATFGEVMCTTYKAFGCVGLITSGAGRDLDQVEALELPLLHRRHHLLARLLPHPRTQRAGPRRRRRGQPRRPAARRPQRRDDDPARHRARSWPRPARSSWRRERGARLSARRQPDGRRVRRGARRVQPADRRAGEELSRGDRRPDEVTVVRAS